MPDATVPTPEDEERAARARMLQRDIVSMTRLYEAVGDMTAGTELEVMRHPDVAEGALALCETIVRRLRETASPVVCHLHEQCSTE